MAKSRPNVNVPERSSENSPELSLGKVLFARQKAEEIVALLNSISTHIITNNVVLEPDNGEVEAALDNLDSLVRNLQTRVAGL